MECSNRLSLKLVRENTVQFYLAFLNIPVEYSAFDGVS